MIVEKLISDEMLCWSLKIVLEKIENCVLEEILFWSQRIDWEDCNLDGKKSH